MPPDYRGIGFNSDFNSGYDQERGLFVQINEQGVPSAVQGRMDGWKDQGYDIEVTQDGPYAFGTATRNRFSLDYNYVERWSVRSELIVKPIWTLPAVMVEADDATWDSPCSYREGIETALKDGVALAAGYGSFPVSSQVLTELRRGVEGYEHDYTVLTRTTNFDFQVPPAPLNMESNRLVYTSAQLIANENIPAAVQFQLPTADPDAEPQTIYGWRIREQTAEITNATTGTSTTSWVYAQWSTLLYTAA